MRFDKELEEKLQEQGLWNWQEETHIRVGSIVDLSSLFNILQEELEKSTQHCKQDLNIDLLAIVRKVYDKSEQDSVHYIGFRDNGVDTTNMILFKINSEYRPTILSKPVYNALYKVVIDKTSTFPVVYIYRMR